MRLPGHHRRAHLKTVTESFNHVCRNEHQTTTAPTPLATTTNPVEDPASSPKENLAQEHQGISEQPLPRHKHQDLTHHGSITA